MRHPQSPCGRIRSPISHVRSRPAQKYRLSVLRSASVVGPPTEVRSFSAFSCRRRKEPGRTLALRTNCFSALLLLPSRQVRVPEPSLSPNLLPFRCRLLAAATVLKSTFALHDGSSSMHRKLALVTRGYQSLLCNWRSRVTRFGRALLTGVCRHETDGPSTMNGQSGAISPLLARIQVGEYSSTSLFGQKGSQSPARSTVPLEKFVRSR